MISLNKRFIFIGLLVLLSLSFPFSWNSYSSGTWTSLSQSSCGCTTVVSNPTCTQTAPTVQTTFTRQIKNFDKHAAKDEPYPAEALAEEDFELVNSLLNSRETPREKRLKQLYNINGAQDWQNYINSLDDDTIPPLTKFTQEYIYKHQFPDPASCKDKTFVLMKHYRDANGMGTIFHGAGHILSLALRNNRIMIWHYEDDGAPGRNFFEHGCGSGGVKGGRSLDCVFEQITSCSLSDLTPENTILADKYWGPPTSLNGVRGSVPPVLGYAMKQLYPDIAPDGLKYWWRTQSAGFLMRLNGAGMSRVRQLRMNSTMHTGVITKSETKEVQKVEVPFPLPGGTFSMHVRHGDKAVEMDLVPFFKYVEVAHDFTAQNPLTSVKTAFISTEDNSIFEEAKQTFAVPNESTTSAKDWVFYYSDIPRINGSPEEQLNAFGNRTEMTLKWIQQLFMALECDIPIGTRGSGWNRMIDELRCAWGTGAGGCKSPFIEVGPFSDWVYYNY